MQLPTWQGRVVLVALLLLPWSARAETGYGLAVGLGAPLAPTDSLGLSLGLSAFAAGDEDGPASMLRARGELLGIVTSDTKAVMPTLVGTLGARLGRLELFIDGGVQMFGFAWRQDWAVFAVFGLTGGAGLSVQLHPQWRVGLRGQATWLPSATTAKLEAPDGADKPAFAFLSAMLTVEFSPTAIVPAASGELMPPPEL